jgi:transcriptional regulator with XRE-family HTH domain
MTLTGEQLKKARLSMRIEWCDLAAMAGVPEATVVELENTSGPVPSPGPADAIRAALEKAGGIFGAGDSFRTRWSRPGRGG